MTREERIILLAEAFGTDIKALNINIGDVSALKTVTKNNIVSAINELQALSENSGATIDDDAGNGAINVVYSVDKVLSLIGLAKQEVTDTLTNGASAAFDTLKELEEALGNDPNFAATIATELSNKVRFDAIQILSEAEQLQVCENIGIGNPDTDFVTVYTTARDN